MTSHSLPDPGAMGAKLEDEYGPVMAEDAIAKVLGFATAGALRKAIQRKRLVGLRLFRLQGRPGWNVYAVDLGEWIEACRSRSIDSAA